MPTVAITWQCEPITNQLFTLTLTTDSVVFLETPVELVMQEGVDYADWVAGGEDTQGADKEAANRRKHGVLYRKGAELVAAEESVPENTQHEDTVDSVTTLCAQLEPKRELVEDHVKERVQEANGEVEKPEVARCRVVNEQRV